MKSRITGQKRVITACIVLMLLLGLYYCWGVFSNALVEDCGWSYASANLPYTLSVLSYAAAIFLFGFFYEKHGPKKTVIIGVSMMLAGLLGSGFIFTKGAVAVCYGVLYGGGSSGCYTAAISTLLKWAPANRRSLFSGIASGAYGLAGVYTSLIVNAFILHGGVKSAFLALGCTIVPLILITVLFIELPGREMPPAENNDSAEAQIDIPLNAAVKTRAFWLLLMLYMFGCAGGNAVISNISNIAAMQGGVKNSFYFVSIMSACSCVGRLVGGYLGDVFSKRKVLATAAAIDAVSLFLFRFYCNVPLLLLGTLFTAFAFGCEMSLIPPFITDYFGITYYSEIYGALILSSCISSFIGPQLAGRLADMSGSFHPAYILCGVYLLITAICTAILPGKKI